MGLGLSVDETVRAAVVQAEPAGPRRPNVAGDLADVLGAAPMFTRAVAGYDRFQVDTYVRWAEEELATAERELEHLMGRHLRLRAELDEARALGSHSAGGGELLRTSRRIGALLADAADQAEEIRAEARAERDAAAAAADALRAEAARTLAAATARAAATTARAAALAARTTAEADRARAEGRALRDRACAEVATRLAEVRRCEQRAADAAARTRRRAAEDASAAVAAARAEIVALHGTGREQRRRADDAAAAARDRLDREAATRRRGLLAEVAELEERRAALRRQVPEPAPALPVGRLAAWLGRLRPAGRQGPDLPGTT
ncbi:hypothetical protein [Trujillonella humicola]|uniref:hypothetical protein n=1 Tax=Trujillonella humicola TaxID=3383699 RepID=UPI003905B0CD